MIAELEFELDRARSALLAEKCNALSHTTRHSNVQQYALLAIGEQCGIVEGRYSRYNSSVISNSYFNDGRRKCRELTFRHCTGQIETRVDELRTKFAHTHEQLKDLVRRHKALEKSAIGRQEHKEQITNKLSQVRLRKFSYNICSGIERLESATGHELCRYIG